MAISPSYKLAILAMKRRLIMDALYIGLGWKGHQKHLRNRTLQKLGITNAELQEIYDDKRDISLNKLLEIEYELGHSFITPSAYYHMDHPLDNGRDGAFADKNKVTWHHAYSEEFKKEAMERDLKFRVVRSDKKTYFIVVKAPQEMADRHGIKYVPWRDVPIAKDTKYPRYKRIKEMVLTDDGFVIPCYGVAGPIKNYRIRGYNIMVYTPWGRGEYYTNGYPSNFYTCDSFKRLYEQGVVRKYGRSDNLFGWRMRALEDDLFSAALLLTGDHDLANSTSSILYSLGWSRTRKRVNKTRVSSHMQDDLRDKLKRVLEERGLGGEAESYVFKTIVDMTEAVMDKVRSGELLDEKLMNTVHKNLEKISTFIAMGPETVKTQQTLQLHNGASSFMAQQIEERILRENTQDTAKIEQAEVVEE